MKLVQEYICTI